VDPRSFIIPTSACRKSAAFLIALSRARNSERAHARARVPPRSGQFERRRAASRLRAISFPD